MPDENQRLLGKRYLILRRLSDSGATGQVYLAEDTTKETGHNLCAVKELNPKTPNPIAYREFCQRFEDEKTYLRALGGYNGQIPKLYECFSEPDSSGKETHYIVQEYIEGKTLREKLNEAGPLSEAKVKELLISLLPVIAHIHSRDFIHRDINPSNVILRARDDLPVLIDFGAVKEVVTTFVTSSEDADPPTQVIGKPGYMAPEHMNGRPVFASDLYSLGVMAIELLTGATAREIDLDLRSGNPAWRNRAPNLSPDLAAVIDTAVNEYAEQRFKGDARAMLAALESAVVAEGDGRFRRQLGGLLSTVLERRPVAPASDYRKCPACPFYVLREDEHCLNCGVYNLRRLSKDQRHLIKKSPREHLALLHSRGEEWWVINLALNYFNFNGREDDFIPIGVLTFAGGLFVGGLVGWLTGDFDYGLGWGLSVAAIILAASVLARAHYNRRIWNITGKKEYLLEGIKRKTNAFRRNGPYLQLIEKEVADLIADNAEQEKEINNRLLSTTRVIDEIEGDFELQKDKEELTLALTQSRRRSKKYHVKQLEIELLILHNKFQASARGNNIDKGTGEAMEKMLENMTRLVNQMLGDLKDANILDSESGRRWSARLVRVNDIVARSRGLLTKQMNDFVKRRGDATVALPEEFALNLNLLNAYITYEDFHKEYQALQVE